jgi:hypothetical protein
MIRTGHWQKTKSHAYLIFSRIASINKPRGLLANKLQYKLQCL